MKVKILNELELLSQREGLDQQQMGRNTIKQTKHKEMQSLKWSFWTHQGFWGTKISNSAFACLRTQILAALTYFSINKKNHLTVHERFSYTFREPFSKLMVKAKHFEK